MLLKVISPQIAISKLITGLYQNQITAVSAAGSLCCSLVFSFFFNNKDIIDNGSDALSYSLVQALYPNVHL